MFKSVAMFQNLLYTILLIEPNQTTPKFCGCKEYQEIYGTNPTLRNVCVHEKRFWHDFLPNADEWNAALENPSSTPSDFFGLYSQEILQFFYSKNRKKNSATSEQF